MKPTEILSSEHRLIEQVLNCLEKMAQQCQSEGKLDKQSAKDAVDFFRNFADRCHHGKEETHLFPAMEAKGFARDCGPTGVMLYEHEQGRKFVRGMDESIEAAANGDAAAQKEFVRNAQEYIDLLREHIQKEDHCLFAMANKAFTDQDQQRLLGRLRESRGRRNGPGVHEKYVNLARHLAERYDVPFAYADSIEASSCGCGH